MSETVFERVRQVVVDQLKDVGEAEVTNEATWDDLNADSLARVEIMMALEEEFSIEVPDEDAEQLNSVGDVVRYITAKTAG